MALIAHIEGLGLRDFVKDKDQIIWYLQVLDRTDKRKANALALLLWKNESSLIEHQAYELLDWIKRYNPAKKARIAKRQKELRTIRERKKELYEITWQRHISAYHKGFLLDSVCLS